MSTIIETLARLRLARRGRDLALDFCRSIDHIARMRKRMAQLDCLWREGEEPGNVVVLLHGFGADAADLFPLADHLDPAGLWTFVCPNAPLEVPIGPGWTGRGWFPISLRDLEVGVDFTQVRPPGLDRSSQMVGELLFELNADKLVIGGFSQGAMVAIDVAMRDPTGIRGLVVYSGALLDEPGWSARAPGLRGLQVLQSHGATDPVLPFNTGRRLHDLLQVAGVDSRFLEFRGGHEIPVQVLNATREFLSRTFS